MHHIFHIHIYTCIYIYVYMYISIYVSVYMCVYIYVCIHPNVILAIILACTVAAKGFWDLESRNELWSPADSTLGFLMISRLFSGIVFPRLVSGLL